MGDFEKELSQKIAEISEILEQENAKFEALPANEKVVDDPLSDLIKIIDDYVLRNPFSASAKHALSVDCIWQELVGARNKPPVLMH